MALRALVSGTLHWTYETEWRALDKWPAPYEDKYPRYTFKVRAWK